MGILELTERAVKLASEDEELREKTKGTAATIVMVLKNGEDIPLTISIDRGEPRFSRGAVEGPDFAFTLGLKNLIEELRPEHGGA